MDMVKILSVPHAGRRTAARAERSRFGSVARRLVRAQENLATWAARRRQRLDLRTLDDRALRDLGLSRADVEGEAGKPFWLP